MKKKVIYGFGLIATTVASINLSTKALAVNKYQIAEHYEHRSDRLLQLVAHQNVDKEKILSKLNLSRTQKNQIKQIRSNYQTQMINLKQQIRSERERLADMMESNQSQTVLRSQHRKMMRLNQQMHNLRFEVMLQMREVLTLDQRRQWRELMEEVKTSNHTRFR